MREIEDNESFKQIGGKLFVELVGGSNLYGISVPSSDVDYRGLYLGTSPVFRAGLKTCDSIVLSKVVDATYYEVKRYVELLRKSNTQVLEMLFAPESAFTFEHPLFKLFRQERISLIDTDVLKNSLRGYVFSELRLATGERTGRLGGKRKEAVDTYSFSPKNFVQILRLCNVGRIFFESGEYMVRVKDFDEKLHDQLMDIKLHPGNYKKEELEAMTNEEFEKLNKAMDSSQLKWTFDVDVAANLILEIREAFK